MQLKPNALRAIRDAEHFRPDDIEETIFRRTAKDVMVTVLKSLMVETGASTPRVVKLLKHYAIEQDQPVKVELIFDVILELERGAAPRT